MLYVVAKKRFTGLIWITVIIVMRKPTLSEAKLRIPLEDRLVPRKHDPLPILSTREIPTKLNPLAPLLLTARDPPKSLLASPLIERSKKKMQLLRELEPIRGDSPSSSEGSRIMRRLQSGRERTVLPELVVLRANQDRKSYLRAPVVRESLVGEQAVQKFYQRYKQLERRKDEEDFLNQKHALTSIVALLQLHNFTPRKLTLVKLRGDEAILDLRKLGIGQGSMGPVVAELMEFLGQFEQVDLSYNRIDTLLGEALVERVGRVKRVDLSHNRIGKGACEKIGQLFLKPQTRIEELSLEENNLLDNAGTALLEHLHRYPHLRKLNLNKNFMGARFAARLRQLLVAGDQQLSELYLSWNEFSSKAVRAIFDGVLQHSRLRVFDFSWNKIEEENVDLLAQIFTESQNLVHADFSFCQLRLKSVGILAKALLENHTLFGVHFEGNSGFINHKGFLLPTEKEFSEYPLPIIRGVIRRIQGIRPNPTSNEYRGSSMRDVCWICQSWQERYFSIDRLPEMEEMQRNADTSSQGECFIHLKHQNYVAVRMFLSEDRQKFQLTRMCPIDSIQFFFSYSVGALRRRFVSDEYQKVYQEQQLTYSIGKHQITEVIDSRNNDSCDYEIDPLDEDYKPNIQSLPRSPDVRVMYSPTQVALKKGQKVVLKQKRTVVREEKVKVALKDLDGEDDEFLKDRNDRDSDEVNLFPYRYDYFYAGNCKSIQEYLKRCIDFDVSNSKIPKIIKDGSQLQRFKTMMLRYYRYFKDSFYYLAHNSPSLQNIFTISELDFAGFLEEQKYVTKRVTMAKVMLKLYACLSQGEESERPRKEQKKPEFSKLISRPQFLQFLVRLAIQKWCFNPHKKKKPQPKDPWEEEDLLLKSKKLKKDNKVVEKQSKKQESKKEKEKEKKEAKPPQKKEETKVDTKEQGQSDEQEDEAELQLKKFKINLPLPLLDAVERTISSLMRYGEHYKSSNWRKNKYLKIDNLIVIKAYDQFLSSLFEKYTEAKFKNNKPKRLLNVLTLDQLHSLIIDTDIRKTKEAMKEVDQAFLDSKRLEIEDGNIQYGLNYDEFLECLARIAENVWFNPPAAPSAELWESEASRKNTPLFIRLQAFIVALYWRSPELHNRRMGKVCEKGIFEVEIALIMEKIQAISRTAGNFGQIRRNSIFGQSEISLREITEELREKYEKMVIRREEIEEYEVQQEIFEAEHDR